MIREVKHREREQGGVCSDQEEGWSNGSPGLSVGKSGGEPDVRAR